MDLIFLRHACGAEEIYSFILLIDLWKVENFTWIECEDFLALICTSLNELKCILLYYPFI